MQQKWLIPGIILGGILLIGLMIVGSYNGLVNQREDVKKTLANVDTQYQRRSDLIPNLVSTVQGAANFEQETLNQVVAARAKATSVQLDAATATPEQLQAFQTAQGELGQALSRLLLVVENYPDLKSVESFRDLQVQLEGTENRITVARKDYNDASASYNATIQRFPTAIIASAFGFESYPYFEADAGSETAPVVDFTQ